MSGEATSLALAGVTLLVLIVGRRVHRLFPSVLVAVGVGLAYSLIADYGGPTVGPIPEGVPPFSLDLPWAELPSLLVAGIVIALVGFVEPSSIARTYAARERQVWDAGTLARAGSRSRSSTCAPAGSSSWSG